MYTPLASAPAVELPLPARLRSWREHILSRILYGAAIFGGLQILVELINQLFRHTPNPQLPLFLVVYGLLLVSALVRRLPYELRAWTLMAITYGLALLDLARFSKLAEGHLYLFVLIAFAIVLFGDWRSLLATGVAVATLIATAIATVLGFLPLNMISEGWLTSPTGWLTNIAGFIALAVVLNTAVIALVARLNESLVAAEEARDALRTANRLLERRVAERTAQLEHALADAHAARAVAEEASEMKSRFLANMSHELRTPLNAIINFSYMLAQGMYGPVTDRQQTYLGRVQSSGEHLLSLINDILDLAKIEAGRIELFVEPVQIGPLIQSAMATAVGLTREKPIELHIDLPEDLPTIQADPVRVRQVLLNLLSNAAKFTHAGTISVSAGTAGDELVVRVADTGIGIPADQLGVIFEEFRQVDGGSNRTYEGTGLGLAICRRLVGMHGGRIWVESQPGAGSTFLFSLPLDHDERALAPLMEPGASQHAGTILVADDDPLAREIVSSYLTGEGYQVVPVADSREVLAAARAHNPQAVILDILMPHRDGWQILADLKADAELSQIPVALYTILEEERLGYHMGASAYLVKPVPPPLLIATVNRLVAGQSHLLVIDDDPAARDVVTRLLEGERGYRVTAAEDGAAGLAAIAAELPDLIILDLMMPGIDGFALLAELDRSPETRRIPTVVVTAKDLTAEERAYLNRRVLGLVQKGGAAGERIAEWVARGLAPAVSSQTAPR